MQVVDEDKLVEMDSVNFDSNLFGFSMVGALHTIIGSESGNPRFDTDFMKKDSNPIHQNGRETFVAVTSKTVERMVADAFQ